MQKYIKKTMPKGYDPNLIAVVSISTLVLALERYHHLSAGFPRASELFYYVLVPLAVSFVLFRDSPRDYGIRIGRWKWAAILVPVCLAAITPLLYLASRLPEFLSYYRGYATDLWELLLEATLYMFAWEFLFRGYMLFGLERSIGKGSIFVQSIPFVLLHFGKPFLETLACIPGGFVLGYVAYKTRSFLPCFIIHFGVYVMMVLFTNWPVLMQS